MKIRNLILGAVAALSLMGGASAYAQTSTGKATTNPPTYVNNTADPLSLDLSGSLRVTCDATCSGGGGGTSDVNISEVGGNAVTTTVPVSAPSPLDVVCTSGCVAGTGTVNGHVTTAAPTYTTGTDQPLSLDTAGNLRVLLGNSSVPVTGTVTVTGTVAATQSGAWNIGTVTAVTGITNPVAVTGTFWQTTQPVSGTVAATQSGAWNTGQMPLAVTGTTNFSSIMANSTNATLVVAGAHALVELDVYNNSANIAYLKIYDAGTAPTCGSGTPVARYIIPGASAGGNGSNIPLSFGKAFNSGIAYCVTSLIADTDTTAVAASAYIVTGTYK